MKFTDEEKGTFVVYNERSVNEHFIRAINYEKSLVEIIYKFGIDMPGISNLEGKGTIANEILRQRK